jgi:hypothetical protein
MVRAARSRVARIRLTNPDTGEVRDAVNGPLGEFEFSALLPAAGFVLEVEADGFRAMRRSSVCDGGRAPSAERAIAGRRSKRVDTGGGRFSDRSDIGA